MTVREPESLKTVPLMPAQALDTASASVLVMMGHTASETVSLVMSWLRMSGDETMHQALKCVRASVWLRPGSDGPPGPCWHPT